MSYAQNAAMELRRRWMKAQGCDQKEIEESCDPAKYHADLAEEIRSIRAQERINRMPTVRERLLQRYFPLKGDTLDLDNL